MSSSLTGPRMLTRVEEPEQMLPIHPIGPNTGISSTKILFLQHVRLLFKVLCCENEVIWDHGELIQNQIVTRQIRNE